MTSTTHMLGGVLTALIVSKGLDVPPMDLVPFAFATSTLPDIDQKIKWLRHRGQTHSLFWSVGLIILYAIYNHMMIIGAMLGVLSHSILDSFNSKGVEWFYPLTDKNYRIMNLEYDGKAEHILMGVFITNIFWLILALQ